MNDKKESLPFEKLLTYNESLAMGGSVTLGMIDPHCPPDQILKLWYPKTVQEANTPMGILFGDVTLEATTQARAVGAVDLGIIGNLLSRGKDKLYMSLEPIGEKGYVENTFKVGKGRIEMSPGTHKIHVDADPELLQKIITVDLPQKFLFPEKNQSAEGVRSSGELK